MDKLESEVQLSKSSKRHHHKKKKHTSLTMPDLTKKKKNIKETRKLPPTARPPPSDGNSNDSLSEGLDIMIDLEQSGKRKDTASVQDEESSGEEAHTISMDEDEPSQSQRFQKAQQLEEDVMVNDKTLLLNDDEYFNLDDNLVRRDIYLSSRGVHVQNYRDKARIICLNFVKQHFEPGATKWYHLKDIYYDLLTSVLNALVFARGKKIKLTPSEKTVSAANSNVGGRGGRDNRRGHGNDDGDNANEVPITPMETTPEIEINNFLQGDKDITVFVETLVKGNEVVGYRWWIFDRAVTKTHNDILSLGLRESFLEAAKIQVQAGKEMQTILKANNGAKSAKAKKAATAKQYAVAKEFGFSNYPTADSHHTGLVMRYITKDPCLAVSMNVHTNTGGARKRQFQDTRPFMTHNSLIAGQTTGENADYAKETHPCNFSRIFAKEAAMFYWVGDEDVNESQCRLESYFSGANGGRVTTNIETAHANTDFLSETPIRRRDPQLQQNAGSLVDVADHNNAADNSKFSGFVYENIAYHVDNTFLSYEFMTRMPLPHRIGTMLYTHKDMVSLKKELGLKITRVESNDADIEGFGANDLDNLFNRMGLDEERSDIYGASAHENPVQYGAIVSYMGLHQTEFELTTDILLSQPHHIDNVTKKYLMLATIPRDILDKFLTNKRNEINARLKIILNNLGPKNRIIIAETMAAVAAQHEDSRNKSLSSMTLTSSKIGSDGRDQSCHTMDQIGHSSLLDEKETNLLQLPYVSFSMPGRVRNANKIAQIKRKVDELKRRRSLTLGGVDDDINALDLDARIARQLHEKKNAQAMLANGDVRHYKDRIEQYRPFGNSLYTLKTQLPYLEVEEVYLGRCIGQRLAENNRFAFENLYKIYYDHVTGEIPSDREDAYLQARRELIEALVVECLHEFKTNRNISFAGEGIRSDLMKRKVAYMPPDASGTVHNGVQVGERVMFGTKLPVHESRQELRSYGEFRTWVQGLFADQFGIAYNYKIMWIVYVASKHHCRWRPFCNSPNLNLILGGNGMVGKSHILQKVKTVLPTGVGDMVTHITDQAFNVDRNMNDMLLIYEEMQNKYFGYSGGNSNKNSSDGGGGGGTSAGSDRDTTNFFKARLTSGCTTTMSWFENEETGMRDMKISKAQCQGNILCASNNCFTDADANVMTRFILLTVPKCKSQYEGERAQDKNKHQFGIDVSQDNAILEQHKEIHRIYFLMEQMVKARVMDDNVYGVNCDGGRILRDLILDHMQKRYGINTNDVRKRDYVLEFARCTALLYAVWMGLTSPLTRHLQYDPHDPTVFIGFNPRVITEGIMPFMVVTKDQIIDAITSLSSLWYHDYQDTIIESFATKHCHLAELHGEDFLQRSSAQSHSINRNAQNSSVNTKKRGALISSGAVNNGGAFGNSYGEGGGNGQQQDKVIDYNYIVMRGKSRDDICQKLSVSLGDMVVAANDISKLLHDLGKSQVENVDGYEMIDESIKELEIDGKPTTYRKKLVKAKARKTLTRPIVEWGHCSNTGDTICALLVHFVKQKLPLLFSDVIIEDLNKNKQDILTDEEREILDNAEPVVIAASMPIEPEVEADMTMEVESATDAYEKKVRAIGRYAVGDETLIIKSFKDVCENMECENPGMEEGDLIELEDSYANPVTGVVPWREYITADAPKHLFVTDFHPELKADLDKIDDANAPIRFVDELKLVTLNRNPLGKKIIIRNHNNISASTRATQSIHKRRADQLEKTIRDDGTEAMELGIGHVLKKARIEAYSRTGAWVLNKELDAVICGEHLLNIGMPQLESMVDYDLYNYPASIYMAGREFAKKTDAETVLQEYPYINNMLRIADSKKNAQGQIEPESVVYEPFDDFMCSNFSKHGQVRSRALSKSLVFGKPIQNRCLKTEREARDAALREMY